MTNLFDSKCQYKHVNLALMSELNVCFLDVTMNYFSVYVEFI
jgi:hypothetical protein